MAGLQQKEKRHGDYYKAGFCAVGRLSWKEREEMAGAEITLGFFFGFAEWLIGSIFEDCKGGDASSTLGHAATVLSLPCGHA